MHIASSSSVDNETVAILTSRIYDPNRLGFLHDQTIWVRSKTGLISSVKATVPDDLVAKNVLDLRHLTVLPGFVDTHVHFFLHPYSETSWYDQVTKESLTERVVRAVVHAKKTLMAGFTSVRDLGTEGAGDADIHLRDCLSSPKSLIVGPRYFCANRAIVSTGSYGPKGYVHVHQEGVDGATGAVAVDGVDECRKEVRRQIGTGADWVKVLHIAGDMLHGFQCIEAFPDYPHRSRIQGVSAKAGSQAWRLFNDEELQTMVTTAHGLGVKVAAHAITSQTIRALVDAKVDSIEHGTALTESDLIYLSEHNVTWNPTLAAYASFSYPDARWKMVQDTFRTALNIPGLKIACGGDTGVFAHGENALEMKWMVRLGAKWNHVLRWATLHGWECIRGLDWEEKDGEKRWAELMANNMAAGQEIRAGDNDVPFGWIHPGFAADIIATSGDLEADFESAVSPESIAFVMKGGSVVKMDGKEVG